MKYLFRACCLVPMMMVAAFAQIPALYRADVQGAESTAANSPERAQTVKLLTDLDHLPHRFVIYVYPKIVDRTLFNAATEAWQRSRIDQQVGATATSAGGTDLVSRPSTPELAGLAMQLGGITEAVSGSTATFTANADGTVRSLAGQPLSCIGCMGTAGLKNLNFLVSFDLNRQGTQQVNPSGPATTNLTQTPPSIVLPKSSNQFSSFTATYNIYNPKDTRSKQYQAAWASWFTKHQKELQEAAIPLLDATNFLDKVVRDPDYATLRGDYSKKLQGATAPAAFESLFAEYLSKVEILARRDVPDFDQSVIRLLSAYQQYAGRYNSLISELAGKPQFSFEYTFRRPVNQPETHNVRFVAAVNPYGGSSLLSLNVASTFYRSLPAGSNYGRVRDFQASAQFDRPLGDIVTHPAVLTVAGYYQYQFDPTVITFDSTNLVPGTNIILPSNAQALLGTKGNLGILQGKVTIKLGASGAQIPLGVTWASRTNLINATDVRGQIGLTYNFDAIFNK
jgi:hypothetical protein